MVVAAAAAAAGATGSGFALAHVDGAYWEDGWYSYPQITHNQDWFANAQGWLYELDHYVYAWSDIGDGDLTFSTSWLYFDDIAEPSETHWGPQKVWGTEGPNSTDWSRLCTSMPIDQWVDIEFDLDYVAMDWSASVNNEVWLYFGSCAFPDYTSSWDYYVLER